MICGGSFRWGRAILYVRRSAYLASWNNSVQVKETSFLHRCVNRRGIYPAVLQLYFSCTSTLSACLPLIRSPTVFPSAQPRVADNTQQPQRRVEGLVHRAELSHGDRSGLIRRS